MIVIVGSLTDETVRCVIKQAVHDRRKFMLVDSYTFPKGIEILRHVGCSGGASGYIRDDYQNCVALQDITGVYMRHGTFSVPASIAGVDDAAEREVAGIELFRSIVSIFDSLPCKVVNRAAPMMSNACKPYQQMIGQSHGFLIPRTIVTSCPSAAREFIASCKEGAVYKAMGGARSIVKCVDISDASRLQLVENCPTLFQEYIQGINIRVHVIGAKVFVTRILTEGIDYRYSRSDFSPGTVSDAVGERCIRMVRDLGLVMSGIDLIETSAGDVYFLEANPSPGFSYYERHSGLPISKAVVDFLCE